VVLDVELLLLVDVDHGCHTKMAIRIATRTITTMPSAAAPPPLSPSFTITGPSAIEVFAPFTAPRSAHRVTTPFIPGTGKRINTERELCYDVG
jgi:hypothetical protein